MANGEEPPGNADDAANRTGIAFMIAAIFTVSVMDAMIKALSATVPTLQIIAFRTGFGLLPVLALVAWSGGLAALRTARPLDHLVRACCALGAMFCFFFSLRFLPLAEAIALAFASPLFVTALSVPILGERVGPRRWAAVGAGFVGMLLIVRPGTEVFSPYAVLPIAASAFMAMAMVLARRLTRTETNASIVFYTTLAGLCVSGVGSAFVWQPPTLGEVGLLALLGLLGGCGTLMFTQAFRVAPAAVIAPFEFTALLWATLFGWLVWDEVPDAMTFVGAGVVVGAGLYILHRETVRGRVEERREPSEPIA
jgi:drug/metabolite transporter (DMT)-like permease